MENTKQKNTEVKTNNFKDDKLHEQQVKNRLRASIMLSIDLDATFKIYSHHCINQEQYMQRVDQLVEMFKKQVK